MHFALGVAKKEQPKMKVPYSLLKAKIPAVPEGHVGEIISTYKQAGMREAANYVYHVGLTLKKESSNLQKRISREDPAWEIAESNIQMGNELMNWARAYLQQHPFA